MKKVKPSKTVSRKRKLKSTISNPSKCCETLEKHVTKYRPIMPGIHGYFSTTQPEDKSHDNHSSDEAEDNLKDRAIKKKRLTAADRTEMIKQEEARLTKIEMQLADCTKEPENANDFDRLLLANPNASELWTKYISFHLAATEINKARSIAKKALETINMTFTQEKFNIWIVLLNLENTFGTKESFDLTIADALKFNDPLQIYLKVIEILAEDGKMNEIEEYVRKIRHKHKANPLMWTEVATVYYKLGKFNEARNLKNCSLKSITDKKTQMSLIIRFAIMEFKYGEIEYGCTIFDTILSTDPKKINIWSTYVDQLVKKNRIDDARKVLERALRHQSIPLKKMKSLFTKLKNFQEKFGEGNIGDSIKSGIEQYITTMQNKTN